MHPSALLILVIYCGAVMVLVGAMLALGYALGPRHVSRATLVPFESGVAPVGDARVRFPVQFYLVAMFFVVFDLEAVFIYAWAVAARAAGWAGYIELVIFIAILIAALAYLWRTGALEWAPRRSRVGRFR